MEITLIIVGGVVLVSAFASIFDYLGKRRTAAGGAATKTIAELETRLAALEAQAADRDETIKRLEGEVSFVNRLLTDKTK